MKRNQQFFKNIVALFFLTSCSIFLNNESSFAGPVYKSTNPQGVPFYSSKPLDRKSAPAILPKIARAHFGEIKPDKLSCANHGGVDCQVGADVDGSVVCYDKFKDSGQRFAFSCSGAKLNIIPESFNMEGDQFSLIVRNLSAVAAKAVKVKSSQGLELNGPTELEPYSSAQYSVGSRPKADTHFQASCENCQ